MMDLRISIQSLSFSRCINSWGPWHPRCSQLATDTASRVHFPVCQAKSALELSPKELHHMRKKLEWKRKRREKKLRKLEEEARVQAEHDEQQHPRRREEGLSSFEKYRLHGKGKVISPSDVWRSGRKEKSTVVSRFEEEFAMRMKDVVGHVKDNSPHSSSVIEEIEPVQNTTRFRDDSELGFRDDLLLAQGHCNNHASNFHVDGDFRNDDSAESNRLSQTGKPTNSDDEIVKVEFAKQASLEAEVPSKIEIEIAHGHNERIENTRNGNALMTPMQCLDHSFSNLSQAAPVRVPVNDQYRASSTWSRDSNGDDSSSPCERAIKQQFVLRREVQDWRVRPKTPRYKDKDVGQRIRDRRKGEPLSTLMDIRAEHISEEAHEILKLLREDVDNEVRRKPVDEIEQLEWLVEQLTQVGKLQRVFLSRLMHGARLKWTEERLLLLVKMLGEKRDWRRALEVVHWVHCREHFEHCHSRHVCTTLMAVLGKCLRPVEALNVFNVMCEHYSTYPDMAAYHCIAVTLGRTGHLEQLLELIKSLKEGPRKKRIAGYAASRFNWNGCLQPDVVVYNAVINACAPHQQWKGVGWVFQQMKSQGIVPNSATYGLAIEVMVKSGQLATAWRYYAIMERGSFLPNASTFKALVEALGAAGETDKAVEMVQLMEQRGVLKSAGVYYALACALCTGGRWSEALFQVEKIKNLPTRKSDVITYTGLIRACENAGRWKDAISVFQRMQYLCAPNVGTYNIMIALYGRHRMFEEAKNLYENVKKGIHKAGKFKQGAPRLTPDVHTYESMLGACAGCEEWEDFENVFQEVLTRGFKLDCRRHAWFISCLVKAGQENMILQMVSHMRYSNGSPSTDVYQVLLSSLHVLGQHTLVSYHLNVLLEEGVALDTEEWSSVFGKALEQLPMVDVEHFIVTKVLTPEKMDDNSTLRKLLHCLISVGAAAKAQKIVRLLGLQMVGDLVPTTNFNLGDSRLLPQEDESSVPRFEGDEEDDVSSGLFDRNMGNGSLVSNHVSLNTLKESIYSEGPRQGVVQQFGGQVFKNRWMGVRVERTQLGQGGNQISTAYFAALAALANPAAQSDSFFRESLNGDRVARAVLVDMEPKVIAAVTKQASMMAKNPWKYSLDRQITQDSGSGNNWARGYHVHGPRCRDSILNVIRLEVEACDKFGGFLTAQSMAGGTGAGLGAYVMEALKDEYPYASILSHCIWPYESGEVIVQNYNALLTLSRLQDSVDGIIISQNEYLSATCRKKFGIQRPSFDNMNDVAAHALASIFIPATWRTVEPVQLKEVFPPKVSKQQGSRRNNADHDNIGSYEAGHRVLLLSDLVSTLCPHPGYHLLSLRFTPQISPQSLDYTTFKWPAQLKQLKQMLGNSSLGELDIDWDSNTNLNIPTTKLSSNSNSLQNLRVPRCNNKCLANLVVLRGSGSHFADMDLFAQETMYPTWTLNPKPPLHVAANFTKLGKYELSAGLLSNCQSTVMCMSRALSRASTMFSSRAYLHQYFKHGMEISAFESAFATVEDLVGRYLSL